MESYLKFKSFIKKFRLKMSFADDIFKCEKRIKIQDSFTLFESTLAYCQ